MIKTVHRKLTEKPYYNHTPALQRMKEEVMFLGFGYEMNMLQHAANDLLQPRPEAIANIMRLSKEL